jgi:glycosyltransferase involved in cell wall biosynthesis
VNAERAPDVSVVIPVSERFDPIVPLYRQYKAVLEARGGRYEFIYVLDGEQPKLAGELTRLQLQGEPIRVVSLARWFGEATALSLGFQEAAADVVLTLPAYRQIEASDIARVLDGVKDADLCVATRRPRLDPLFNRLQYSLFAGLVRACAGFCTGDLGCGVRAFRRQVLEEVNLYGDLHRFLPMLAHRQGFKVLEVDVRQAPEDVKPRVYRPGIYVRRLLDVVTVAFLLRFLKRPFRFFGLVSYALLLIGGALMAYVFFERFALGVPMGARPALTVASIILVLGVQIFAIGLLAELIIFTHARGIKDYRVERAVNLQARAADDQVKRGEPSEAVQRGKRAVV